MQTVKQFTDLHLVPTVLHAYTYDNQEDLYEIHSICKIYTCGNYLNSHLVNNDIHGSCYRYAVYIFMQKLFQL